MKPGGPVRQPYSYWVPRLFYVKFQHWPSISCSDEKDLGILVLVEILDRYKAMPNDVI
jgi:hypothetical protein